MPAELIYMNQFFIFRQFEQKIVARMDGEKKLA